ncbi:MAG: hypothetical protein ACLFUJ_15030 [Phycisphaerae bacterium]
MYEQAHLQDQAAKLMAQTQKISQLYATLAQSGNSPELREQFAKLHREKTRHAMLAERMREILE